MNEPRILIVEDDADINTIVATRLTREGYACMQAYSGSEARLLIGGTPGATNDAPASAFPFDLVICDLMLPGLTGEELTALVRERTAETPIVVISARTDTADKIDLLKLGADDYLTKPFDLDELAARVAVQLRHRGHGASLEIAREGATNTAGATPSLRFRSWTLDTEARTFTAAGAPVDLTRTEFNIVEMLMRHPKRVFSKQELFEGAWGEAYAADDNTVNVHVSNIRAKLKPSGTSDYIKTVWGMGFKLVE